jgi:hypothetical protein
LIGSLAGQGRAPRTLAGALATLGSILRYALRRGYITDNPLRRLEAGERPRLVPRARRSLGRTRSSGCWRRARRATGC